MKSTASKKEVAVIIPAVKEDRYLRQAVGSINSQTYPETLAVVVKDGAFESDWLDREAREGHLRLVELPTRQGTPFALNAGIAAVPEVHYIARLDADDLCEPERIAAQVERLEASHKRIAVAVTSTKLINEDGETIGSLPLQRRMESPRAKLLLSNWIIHSTIMVRADVLREVGGYNPKCIRMQDYELYLRLALNYDFMVLEEALVSYRLHGSQFSRKTKPWGVYIQEVTRARLKLAKKLGQSTLRQRGLNAAWVGVQWLRWLGIRKSGLDKVAESAGTAN